MLQLKLEIHLRTNVINIYTMEIHGKARFNLLPRVDKLIIDVDPISRSD